MFKTRFKPLSFWLVAVVSVLSQASLVHAISVAGVVPHIVMLCVIFYALYEGPAGGLAAGALLGGMSDLFSAGIMGLQALLGGCVGLAVGLLRGRVYTTHPLTRFLIAAIASLGYSVFYYAFAVHFHYLPPLRDSIGRIWLLAGYTAVVNLGFASWMERVVIEKVYRVS